MEGKQEVTDEPEAPPVDHTIDALRYMMARLNRSQPEKRLPTILTPEVAKDAIDQGIDLGSAFAVAKWSDEFNLNDEQMKAIGMDVGAVSKGAIYVTTWTPEGLRHTEIPTADFYMPDPHGGNIGGNGSDST